MRKAMFLAGILVIGATAARAGEARNSGAPDPDLLIGRITTYATQQEAHAACPRDVVVWADRYAGYFYYPREKQFGATDQGAFACRRDAERGNYWDTSPMSSMAHMPSREFPYTPLYVGS